MKNLIKYSNFILFVFLFILFVFFESHTKFSTSLSSILPSGHSKELIDTFNETQNSKLLLLAIKGFDKKSLEKIQSYEEKLLSLPKVENVTFQKNITLQNHLKNYKLFQSDLNQSKLENLNVEKELKKLYHEMKNSFFPRPIDKQDPFNLFIDKKNIKLELLNGYPILKEYGYFLTFKLTSESLDEHKQLYNQIHTIIKPSESIKLFSSIFYFVENSNAIRSDVNIIILISTILLLLLYIIIIKNISLLTNTLLSLTNSSMIAIIILDLLYSEISIFVFVFGMSISTIAIDYMFHHYLHGYYNNATKHKTYNKEVLFGFLTTISAFFILSFSSFLLIQQITIFALIALSLSYLQFAFLYPLIQFKKKPYKKSNFNIKLTFINLKMASLFSLMIILISLFFIKFDFNLKNLDYDNKNLKSTEMFFLEKLSSSSNKHFVIKAKTIDRLIEQANYLKTHFPTAHIPISDLISKSSYDKSLDTLQKLQTIKKELSNQAEQLKFKKGYFNIAYSLDQFPLPSYTLDTILSYEIDIFYLNNTFICYGTINSNDYEKVIKFDFVESLALKEHFEKYMKNNTSTLIKLGLISLCVILVLLYYFTKKHFLKSIAFLLFPISMILLYGTFVPLNILHLFMMFIILAIGIDYAIYLSSNNHNSMTKRAISYALISTFAGFGVLILSNIPALFSLGIIATIGILTIFILLFFSKRKLL